MDNSSSGMIELSQVTTSRGQFPVLSRFTLTISQGQFINLYGRPAAARQQCCG